MMRIAALFWLSLPAAFSCSSKARRDMSIASLNRPCLSSKAAKFDRLLEI